VLALGFGALVAAHIVPLGLGRESDAPAWLVLVSTVLGLAGALLGWLVYRHGLAGAGALERLTGRAAGAFDVDRLYRAAFVRPFAVLARDLEAGAERANERAVDGIAGLIVRGGATVRRLQGGSVRGYEALLLTGAVILLAFWSLR